MEKWDSREGRDWEREKISIAIKFAVLRSRNKMKEDCSDIGDFPVPSVTESIAKLVCISILRLQFVCMNYLFLER